MKPTYDVNQSYEWNYHHGPIFAGQAPPLTRRSTDKIKLFNWEIASPLGVPAGPLLNSNWIKLYAELGWDIPVYKTVRTISRPSHPAPNCIFIPTDKIFEETDAGQDIIGTMIPPAQDQPITITNSFGMPAKDPSVWMADVAQANEYLSDNQVMIVSVVGTPGEGKNLIDDYVRCAQMAKEAGAKIIEANYSCPNVCSGEGSIFADHELSSQISRAIKKAIGSTPLLIKIGTFTNPAQLAAMAQANAPWVDGIAGINTIAMKVYDDSGQQALPGEGRLVSGLCGHGIVNVAQNFTQQLKQIKKDNNYDFIICGVGGITTVADIEDRLQSGADIVMSATGAMWNPLLAKKYHQRSSQNQ